MAGTSGAFTLMYEVNRKARCVHTSRERGLGAATIFSFTNRTKKAATCRNDVYPDLMHSPSHMGTWGLWATVCRGPYGCIGDIIMWNRDGSPSGVRWLSVSLCWSRFRRFNAINIYVGRRPAPFSWTTHRRRTCHWNAAKRIADMQYRESQICNIVAIKLNYESRCTLMKNILAAKLYCVSPYSRKWKNSFFILQLILVSITFLYEISIIVRMMIIWSLIGTNLWNI